MPQNLPSYPTSHPYVVHVDMDSFFASVEMKNLNWDKDKPLAVGGESMLSTANYAARKFGVRSAMPGFIAKKLCPELTIVGSNFEAYEKSSKLAQEIFEDYCSFYVMGSLDEGYLDITDHMVGRETDDLRMICKKCFNVTSHTRTMEKFYKLPWNSFVEDYEYKKTCKFCGHDQFFDRTFDKSLESAIEEMRFRVEMNTGGLTCSVGLSCNTFLAKCLSDKAKPNGSKILLEYDQILEFIKVLPVGRAPGIGPVTEKYLKEVYNIEQFSDIQSGRSGDLLSLMEDENSAKYYIELSYGCGGYNEINKMDRGERKGLGHETTFSEIISITNTEKLSDILEDLCKNISDGLKSEDLFTKTIHIKYTTDQFDKYTRQQKLDLQYVQKQFGLNNLLNMFENYEQINV